MKRTIVAVEGVVQKLCPYVDEIDIGHFKLLFDYEAPELHHLAEEMKQYCGVHMSHEEFTRTIVERFNATAAVTTWSTAGLDVTVTYSETGTHNEER